MIKKKPAARKYPTAQAKKPMAFLLPRVPPTATARLPTFFGTLTEHCEVLTIYAKLTLTVDSTRFSLTVPRLN
jgi:hypothetical protein